MSEHTEPVASAPAEPVVASIAAAPAAPALHTDTPSLLEGLTQEESAEPATTEQAAEPVAAPADLVKPEPGAPEPAATPAPEPPAPEPVKYDPFTLPESIKADDAALTSYQELIGAHRVPQEAAQKLVDLHAAAMTKYAEHLAAEQHRIFAETRASWREALKSDEQMGGAGHQTALRDIAYARDLLVPADRHEAFNEMLRVTGVGDHPEFLRVLHAAARLLKEPGVPAVQPNPTPDRGRAPRGRFTDMYNHPSTVRAR